MLRLLQQQPAHFQRLLLGHWHLALARRGSSRGLTHLHLAGIHLPLLLAAPWQLAALLPFLPCFPGGELSSSSRPKSRSVAWPSEPLGNLGRSSLCICLLPSKLAVRQSLAAASSSSLRSSPFSPGPLDRSRHRPQSKPLARGLLWQGLWLIARSWHQP